MHTRTHTQFQIVPMHVFNAYAHFSRKACHGFSFTAFECSTVLGNEYHGRVNTAFTFRFVLT